MPKNAHNVYHGFVGLANNPQSSPQMKAYAESQMAQTSNQFHGAHGSAHNPSTSAQGKAAAESKMQATQPDAWKNR
ncbi:uncharacterized protein RHOBADRAFT_56452 [Rhodotorula graminis WP1]|uniref:Uncharacterized protein n=1 Tax=Rhodotorula graminis (strain WP1) TaxID=578459 RepID=A0A0P9IQ87_RHOGW|nr:uncharacterized protein RHOBADRAFT_56452 [Rhodotorula graminis WP1]KPV71601.1 hypothetical protein RHOBADRAFT_56452 [Rhodotorula graminis WP1]